MKRSILKSGFTLIELLVVISIISLLISILLPALAKARDTALDLLCATRVRGTGLAFQTYFNDSKGFFPPVFSNGASVFGAPSYGSWYKSIRIYAGVTPKDGTPAGEDAQAMICPFSHAYDAGNPYNLYATLWPMRFVTFGNGNTSWRIDDFTDHEKTGLLIGNYAAEAANLIQVHVTIVSDAFRPIPRHNGRGVGAAFLDGHAQFITVDPADANWWDHPSSVPFMHKTFWGHTASGKYLDNSIPRFTP